jgi:hypothetical protein
MKQPWIHKAKTDGLFILSPPFIILAVVVFCQPWLQMLENDYSFYTWLFFVVFIDVAHVYATLFKTYLVPKAFQERKKLLILLPILCFALGMILFMLGSKVFWVTLAYIAVFHFIRQQYGFMRLYSRYEAKTGLSIIADNIIIYTATGYPMLYWFMSPGRKFTWFIQDEFFSYRNDALLKIFGYAYIVILVGYGFLVLYECIKSGYLGIVYYNNDLVFTMLNIVSHGVPYMALIYLKEIKQSSETHGIIYYLTAYKSFFIYAGFLIVLAFSEEYLWEIMVWNEKFKISNYSVFENWHFLLVPLLVVPQFTHYILDGFIWKTKKAS